jgi:hypothetical protein
MHQKAICAGPEGGEVRLRITVTAEVELSEDSLLCTPEEYESFKDDPETMYEVFSDELYDAMAFFENWKVEEIPLGRKEGK